MLSFHSSEILQTRFVHCCQCNLNQISLISPHCSQSSDWLPHCLEGQAHCLQCGFLGSWWPGPPCLGFLTVAPFVLSAAMATSSSLCRCLCVSPLHALHLCLEPCPCPSAPSRLSSASDAPSVARPRKALHCPFTELLLTVVAVCLTFLLHSPMPFKDEDHSCFVLYWNCAPSSQHSSCHTIGVQIRGKAQRGYPDSQQLSGHVKSGCLENRPVSG